MGEAAAAAYVQTRMAGNAAEKAGAQAETGGRQFITFANAVRTLAAGVVFREFIEANSNLEGMTRALESVTGSSEAARKEMAFVREESRRLGLEIGQATNSYVLLAASAKGTALEGKATRDSTITAEAAMRGYTVVVDDAGKTHVAAMQKAKDSTRDLIQEQEALNAAIARANEELAREVEANNNPFGTTQQRIDDFYAHMQGLGEGVASVINGWSAKMYDLSDATGKAFDAMALKAGYQGATIDRLLSDLADSAEHLTRQFADQTARAKAWSEQIASGTLNAQQLDYISASLSGTLNLLGDQQLDPLRGAIEDARRKMRDLEAASKDTLTSIQDEFDQYFGNLDALQKRQDEAKRAALNAQLAAANAAGDRTAAADLQKAISLWEQLARAKEADARLNEAQARAQKTASATTSAATTTTTATTTANTVHTVKIELPGGSTQQVNVATQADALTLANLFSQLKSDMARAA